MLEKVNGRDCPHRWIVLMVAAAMTVVGAGSAQASGSLDPSFGVNGVANVASGGASSAADVAQDSGGRLVLVGNKGLDSGPGTSCEGYSVVRVLANGASDMSFGSGGIVDGPERCDSFTKIDVLHGEDPVIVGSKGLVSHVALAPCVIGQKLDQTGSVAENWGNSGMGFTAICNSAPGKGAAGLVSADLATDNRGRTLVAGQAWHGQRNKSGFLLRLTPGGNLDRVFDGDSSTSSRIRGMVEFHSTIGAEIEFKSVVPLPSGQAVAGGTSNGNLVAAKFRNDGSLFGAFGRGGFSQVDPDRSKCACSEIESMTTDTRGRFVFIGSTFKLKGQTRTPHDHRLFLARLQPGGEMDRRFGSRGLARPGWSKLRPRDVAVQRDGKIVILGSLGSRSVLMRVLYNGKLDKTFFDDGVFKGFSGRADSVLVDRNGRIVVSGGSGQGSFQLTRIRPN